MENELLYTQEDINEWMRTCDELLIRNHELRYEISEIEEKTRKQVCDAIRNSIEDVEHSEENEAKQSSESAIYTKELFEFLNKIEKGESNNEGQ